MITMYALTASLVMWLTLTLSAQTPVSENADTLKLPAVLVEASRFDVTPSQTPVRLSGLDARQLNLHAAQTVGSALQNLPAMNVRSYGPALAQTVSMYGFSGSQLSVLWGDVPLNHAMLGLADLSLYPSLMIDKVDVNAQQGSAEYGAHAIGGIITLEHERAPQARQSLQYQRSNLDASTYQARIQQPIGRWYIDAGTVYQDAPNAFSYLDITQNPAEHKRRINADKSLASAVGIIAYTSRSYTSENRIWLTDVRSGIPGSIVSLTPEARQNDRMGRFTTRHTWLLAKHVTMTTSAFYARHQLDFLDPRAGIESLSLSESTGLRSDVRIALTPDLQIRTAAGGSRSAVDASTYSAAARQHYYAQLNAVLFTRLGSYLLIIHPSIRSDYYTDFDAALTASLGLVMVLEPDKHRLFVNINRNYAPPTFNDLYWPELGNPDLIPETSHRLNLGSDIVLNDHRLSVELFANRTENGIQWLPSRSDGQFRPDNIREVTSIGSTVDYAVQHNITRLISFQINASYTYLNARYTRARFPGDAAVEQQLVYQPENRIQLGTEWVRKHSHIDLSWRYTGARSAVEDGSIVLEPFAVTDITLSHAFQQQSGDISVALSVQNLFGRNYQEIRFYPMPGRIAVVTLQFTRKP